LTQRPRKRGRELGNRGGPIRLPASVRLLHYRQKQLNGKSAWPTFGKIPFYVPSPGKTPTQRRHGHSPLAAGSHGRLRRQPDESRRGGRPPIVGDPATHH